MCPKSAPPPDNGGHFLVDLHMGIWDPMTYLAKPMSVVILCNIQGQIAVQVIGSFMLCKNLILINFNLVYQMTQKIIVQLPLAVRLALAIRLTLTF